jgi:hypothetical protein
METSRRIVADTVVIGIVEVETRVTPPRDG